MKTNENFQLSTFNFQPDKRLAVVILNWNGRALMEEFLPSVVACTPGEWADVIVADNGSTDDSIEMLKTKFPTVGIIRLDKNYGFAEGYNQALKHIGHEYTVLLNSDVEVTPGWLDAPIAALDADTAYCYFLQDTRRGHYWGHRVIVQKGCKVISADIWWTYDSDFPAETFARALLTAISE